MGRGALSIGVVLAAGLLATGCERKPEDIASASAPAAPASNAAPAAPSGACAVVAAHAKKDMPDGFGFPLKATLAPAPAEAASAAELKSAFVDLTEAQAGELAAALSAQATAGSQLNCDWQGLGLPRPRIYDKGPAFIRFRAGLSNDARLAVLDTYTEAGDYVAIGTWCLYRQTEAGWERASCVPTVIK